MSETAPLARSLTQDVLACLGFYTRLPLPASDLPERGFAAAQWAAPVAGIVIGVLGGMTLLAGLWLGLPSSIAAALSLVVTMVVTGALHEDGLADVADGFGGGTTREKKLAIMKDSRIGTYGVLALILSVLLRWSALTVLATAALPALIAAHAASRALMPALMAALPPARNDGLSAGAGRPEGQTAFFALLIGGGILLLTGAGFFLVAVSLLALAFFAVKRLAARQIGGQTGDVLGALQQAAEILILVAATALFT